jgi:class 3 adenylate cyclase
MQHAFGYIQDGKVFLKGFLGRPDRVIGEVKGDEESTILYFETRFTQLEEKVARLKAAIEENQNKGSFLMKLIHLKESLYESDALGDFASLIAELEVQESFLSEIIQENRSKNLALKRELIIEATALQDSTDWKETTEKFKELNVPEFKHGIGINSGECNVGNMGSDQIFSYTALGDNVNLGARLEDLCKHYGIQLHISGFTKDLLTKKQQDEFTFRIIDNMRVRGKSKIITSYEVLHNNHPFMLDNNALLNYHKAFDFYQNRKFKEAYDLLVTIEKAHPKDRPTKILAERCKNFIKNPPGPDWDKITTHENIELKNI